MKSHACLYKTRFFKRGIMIKKDILVQGSSKDIYATNDDSVIIKVFRDDVACDAGKKTGTIAGKGRINHLISNYLFKRLESESIKTDMYEKINDTESACKKAVMIPLNVIVRNYSAGAYHRLLQIPEGNKISPSTVEFTYKKAGLGEPVINGYYALSLGILSNDEIDQIVRTSLKANQILVGVFAEYGLDLIDLKLEYGRHKGDIILADEISVDTCRLWDKTTHEKLDKDRFRMDLGHVEDAYKEVLNRFGIS